MAKPGTQLGVYRPIKDITADIKKLVNELDEAVNAQQSEEKNEGKNEEKKSDS